MYYLLINTEMVVNYFRYINLLSNSWQYILVLFFFFNGDTVKS